MVEAYFYLGLSGVLTVLLWVPHVVARLFVWGLPALLRGYSGDFPASEPKMPLWAERARRAHLNMVETMPAFIAVVAAAGFFADQVVGDHVGQWAMIFFCARIAYSVIYWLGIPFLRTPAYLVSWASILMIGWLILNPALIALQGGG